MEWLGMAGATRTRKYRATIFNWRGKRDGREGQKGQESAPYRRAEGFAEGQASEANDGHRVLVQNCRVRLALQLVPKRRYYSNDNDNRDVIALF